MGKTDRTVTSHRRRSRSKDRTKVHGKHGRKSSISSDSSSSSNGKHKSRSKISRRSRSSVSSSSESDSSRERRHRKKHSKHKSKKKKKNRSRDREESRIPTAEEYDRMKLEERREKEEMKNYETPEEKRARRMLKKEQKERKRKAKMGWDEEYMGYTNADNPFGDEHLLQTFVWNKKLQKEGLADAERHDIDKLQQRKMIENKLELEKVKKRRLEREREREERENEREMLQRQKESEYYQAWEKQEDTFHLQQARLRSKIRIEDGRAKPIDLLAWYIGAEDDDDVAIEMHEPYTYLNGLTITDLEDLLEDIKVYMEMEKEEKNIEFWRDVTTITEEELSKLRKIDPNTRDYIGERRSGINQSVTEDVASVFKGKTLEQLSILQKSIQEKFKGGEGVDVGYWESLLGQLKAHMATSRLREKHQDHLRRKLFKLKQQQGIEQSTPLFPIVKHGTQTSRNSPKPREKKSGVDSDQSQSRSNTPVPTTVSSGQTSETKQDADEDLAVAGTSGMAATAAADATGAPSGSQVGSESESDEDEQVLGNEDIQDQYHDDYLAGSYSPRLVQVPDLEPDTLVYDPLDDMKRLEFARTQVLRTGQAKKDADDDLLKIAKAGMNEEEASFSVMVPLEKQTMIWSDKYRPRKPRFFNRVHTGFEWNKYNQTHYDMDNPPPKIVQGYKFNIFYPDLIDKSKAPTYTITPIEGEGDFGVLRFVAGPPYEDIAFKIVNREWEYSYKRGFRCQFQNNIFQLWFHFKRYRYRR